MCRGPRRRPRLGEYGRVDMLVDNAGVNVFHGPLATPEESAPLFAVDLEGAWRVSSAVLPGMIWRLCGRLHRQYRLLPRLPIIPRIFPYPVAKHGLARPRPGARDRVRGQAHAGERHRAGIHRDQLALDYWNTFPDPEAERRACDLHRPSGSDGPRRSRMTAVFLASDEAPFINAACITIDGGRSVLYHD